jgi:hypothetical protein
MATITQSELRSKLLAAPPGTDRAKVIQLLLDQGHTIEGLDAPTTSQEVSTERGPLDVAKDVVTFPGRLAEAAVIKPAVGLGKALFGTTAGAVKSVIGSGIERGAELLGIETEGKFQEEAEERLGTPAAAAKTLGFSLLEVAPIGAAFKVLGKIPGVSQVSSFLDEGVQFLSEAARESAVKSFSQALGATTQALKKKTGEVVPQLLEQRVTAFSRGGLLNKAEATLEALGEQFDEVLKTIPEGAVVKTGPIVESLENLRQAAVVNGQVVDTALFRALDDKIAQVQEFGEQIPFNAAREYRQVLDSIVARSRGFLKDTTEGTALDATKSLANSLRGQLAKESPDLNAINATYSLWSDVKQIAEATIQRTSTQRGGIGKELATVAGGLVGTSTGNALGFAVVGRQLSKLVNSTAWKTVSATLKNDLAEALATDNVVKVVDVLRRMGTVTNNLITEFKD